MPEIKVKASCDVFVDVPVECSLCGETLKATSLDLGDDYCITVEPCEVCLEKARREACGSGIVGEPQ